MRFFSLMFLLIYSHALAGPYEDAQQWGQAGMDTIPGSISNGSVTNQSVPGFQTSSPPEAQLNNQAALNNAALLGTAQDASGAGQFIYNSNANNAQFTFSPNDPLITGSNQIQTDAYSMMSNLNPANAGATTCVDIVTNTTGIVDTYTCNQSRPSSTLVCSKKLSVTASSSSSCALGSVIATGDVVSVLCAPTLQFKVVTIFGTRMVTSGAASGRVITDDNCTLRGVDYSESCIGNNCTMQIIPLTGQINPPGFVNLFTCPSTNGSGNIAVYPGTAVTIQYQRQNTIVTYTDTWVDLPCN